MDVEGCICANVAWQQLPDDVRAMLGNSQKEYDKLVVEYSIRNQLRHKGNLVRHIKKDSESYYDTMLKYSSSHLMLFPYHLADVVVKELRITPFNYYVQIIVDMINAEKSYDSLPNFTAADAMRLLGIGRNQYIELMNQNRSNRRLFRRGKPIRELLPAQPAPCVVESWWMVHTGCLLESDIKSLTAEERRVVDLLLDVETAGTVPVPGGQPDAIPAGLLDLRVVQALFHKGLVYFDLPVADNDYVYVGPLDGFVMNRVLGDYFETLLYKIFVTINDETAVVEIAEMLHIDAQLVKNAVSLFCRLGFAKKRVTGLEGEKLHPSWASATSPSTPLTAGPSLLSAEQARIAVAETAALSPTAERSLPTSLPADFSDELSDSLQSPYGDEEDEETATAGGGAPSPPMSASMGSGGALSSDAAGAASGRAAFLFDSTLTAFLMMGNLSASLKGHAVTLFEVGKLTDEQLKDFMEQLDHVNRFAEGEAQRYSEHATTLLHTLRSLRTGRELDLVRGESLLSLDSQSRARVLHKSYSTIVSMAPLCIDACTLPMTSLPLLGPPIPEVCSPWLRLSLYAMAGSGPPSLFIPHGTRLSEIPRLLQKARRFLVSSSKHEPQLMPAGAALQQLNDLLMSTPLFVQEYNDKSLDGGVVYVPFPFASEEDKRPESLANHPAVQILRERLSLGSLCGYVVMAKKSSAVTTADWDEASEREASPYAAAAAIAFGTPKRRPRAIDVPEEVSADELSAAAGDNNGVVTLADSSTTVPRRTISHTINDFALLDVVFGVPLFDERLNAIICDRMKQQQILAPENRVNIQFANKILVDLTMELIEKHNFGVTSTTTSADKVELVPPVRPIGFDPERVVRQEENEEEEESEEKEEDEEAEEEEEEEDGIVVFSPFEQL